MEDDRAYTAPHYQDCIQDTDPFCWFIEVNIRRYRETGNSAFLYDAFKQCHDNRVYPPAAVMEWLANAVLQDDPSQIAARLGLKAQRGKENPVRERYRQGMNEHCADLVYRLCRYAGVSITAAAEGVYLRESQAGRDVPSAEWIQDQYRRHWKNVFSGHPDMELLNEIYEAHPDWLQEFLETFPPAWRARYVLK